MHRHGATWTRGYKEASLHPLVVRRTLPKGPGASRAAGRLSHGALQAARGRTQAGNEAAPCLVPALAP